MNFKRVTRRARRSAWALAWGLVLVGALAGVADASGAPASSAAADRLTGSSNTATPAPPLDGRERLDPTILDRHPVGIRWSARVAKPKRREWHWHPIRTTGQGGRIERTVYVPEGSVWIHNALRFQVRPVADAFVSITLDGKRLLRRQFDRDRDVEIQLPDLTSGYHNLVFRIAQQRILVGSARDDNDSIRQCRNDNAAALIVKNMVVDYHALNDNRVLADLPDALFNPQVPARNPLDARVRADAGDDLSASVLARLASAWHARAGIDWHVGAIDRPDRGDPHPADFTLTIQHVPTLKPAARIVLKPKGSAIDPSLAHQDSDPNSHKTSDKTADENGPENDHAGQKTAKHAQKRGEKHRRAPELIIRFRDRAGAMSAVNALLNTTFAKQLRRASADLDASIAPPRWGTPQPYKHLADFGVTDFKLGVQKTRKIFLQTPSTWQITGPVKGEIAYRVQDGLLQGSVLNFWMAHALAGSDTLTADGKTRSSARRLSFATNKAPSAQRFIPARLDAQMLVTERCLPGYDGVVWVDADASRVAVPHRTKAGVGGLLASLIARPHIAIDDADSAALAAALGVAGSMRELVGDQPLAFRITGVDDGANAPVTIAVDRSGYDQAASRYPDKLSKGLRENGTWIHQDKQGQFHIVAGSATALRTFTKNWPDWRFDIPGGAGDVFLGASSGVIAPERSAVAEKMSETTADRYNILILCGIAGLVVLMLLAWWLGRRR